ncbi:MAG: DUF4390 domain-containing protein [Nitrospirota bacterium]|jgi:hypothetical protein
MPRIFLKLALALTLVLLPLAAEAQEIVGPRVLVNEGHMVVSTALDLSEKQLEDISKGISKEIDIYVDLFRVWTSWPDEFVLGTKFTRTLRCDPVKKEYVATSLVGNVLREKRFTDCRSLVGWALSVDEHTLTSVKELEPSRYFVRVTAEGRLRKLPPVVGYLFFFVKEREFKVESDSAPFAINGGGPGGEAGP